MQRKKDGRGQRAQGLVPRGSPDASPRERGEGGARGRRCGWAKQETMSAPETQDRRGSVEFRGEKTKV